MSMNIVDAAKAIVSAPRTPSNTIGNRAAPLEPARVVRLPDPALAHMIRMRGQGYGWEDAAVYLQREGILVSNADIRRFFLGPRRTTAPPRGASQARPLEAD